MKKAIFILIIAALLGSYLFSALSWHNPVRNHRQIRWLTTEQEVAIGRLSMGLSIQELGGESSNEPLKGYIDEVGQKLAALADRPELDYQFIVLNTGQVNAWAFPGGGILISEGMIDRMENEAELAFILSHELGHVVGRHIEGRYLQAIGATAAAFFSGSPLVSLLLCAFYSRHQEYQADGYAVTLMRRAGYDVKSALNWFKAVEQGSGKLDLLATHPTGERRFAPLYVLESQS